MSNNACYDFMNFLVLELSSTEQNALIILLDNQLMASVTDKLTSDNSVLDHTQQNTAFDSVCIVQQDISNL